MNGAWSRCGGTRTEGHRAQPPDDARFGIFLAMPWCEFLDHRLRRRCWCEVRRFNAVTGTHWLKGRVVEKRKDYGQALVELELWGATSGGRQPSGEAPPWCSFPGTSHQKGQSGGTRKGG